MTDISTYLAIAVSVLWVLVVLAGGYAHNLKNEIESLRIENETLQIENKALRNKCETSSQMLKMLADLAKFLRNTDKTQTPNATP